MTKKYIIMVAIPNKQTFRFSSNYYPYIVGSRISFTDSLSGLKKDFPLSWCSIEEVKLCNK